MLGRLARTFAAAAALLSTMACDHDLSFGLRRERQTAPRVEAAPHPSTVPRIAGENRALVRTTVKGLPATGAHCRLVARSMSLEFFTPAEIVLPVLHHPMTPATLICTFGSHKGSVTLHAKRKLETRDDIPDMPFGLIIGKAAEVTAGFTDLWSYVENGSTLTIELAP